MKTKIPLHKQIVSYIQEKKRVHGGDLERFGQSLGYEAYTTRRRAQELTQKERDGKPAHINYNPNIKATEEKGCVVYLWQEIPNLAPNLTPAVTSYRDLKEREADERVRKWNEQFQPVKKEPLKQTNQLF